MSGWWTLRVVPPNPSRPLVLGRGAVWALGLTTAAGVAGALWPALSGAGSVGRAAAASASCLAMLLVGVRWSRGDRTGLRTYFALQTLLGAAASTLTEGRSGLVWMPLISQACLVLPTTGVALALVLWGAVFLVSMRSPSLDRLVGQGLSFVVAGTFTWLFTGLAVRERAARNEGERLAASLSEANQRLERLTLERERVRLAHEIHDGLGHSLTAARVHLEAARALLERDPPRARAGLETASRLIQEGLDDVRQSVRALRESAGAEPSLEVRLERLCQDSLPLARLEVRGERRSLAPSVEHALFRAAQEALTNVRRHAEAREAHVRLLFGAEDVQLVVEDDGRGVGTAPPGVGLSGLAERARRHGGMSRVSPRPGGGTVVLFSVKSKPERSAP